VQVLQLGPKIVIGKNKYGCKYYNEAPKFELVEANMGVSIATKPQNSSW